jgi:hypothetical protein
MIKLTKAIVAIMLVVAAIVVAGCKKDNANGDGNIGGHTYVDLGLPSGILWAACNVGANSPEDYGDYFAWGETTSKSFYSWNTYKYACLVDDYTPCLTKYNFSDHLVTLLPEDDAATANWGAEWRIPTTNEWRELYRNTSFTWTTQDGVEGMLFTASNRNSLFLPAAGSRNGSEPFNVGLVNYWSSSLDSGKYGMAYIFEYNYGSQHYPNNPHINYAFFFGGLSIRPVCSR